MTQPSKILQYRFMSYFPCSFWSFDKKWRQNSFPKREDALRVVHGLHAVGNGGVVRLSGHGSRRLELEARLDQVQGVHDRYLNAAFSEKYKMILKNDYYVKYQTITKINKIFSKLT